VSNLSFQVGNLSFQVGDLSPKGRVGASRLAPVVGWQFVSPNGLKSDFLPKTGANRLSPMCCFGETSATFLETSLIFEVGDLSPKGRVGASRPASVLSRQFVLPSCLESDY
jgi:hypothetical protein